MPKLDEYKEIIGTLRTACTVSFGILVLIVTGLVKRLDANNVDSLFWSGVLFSIIIILVILKLFQKISQLTKKVGDI
jgi:hypothetical protein